MLSNINVYQSTSKRVCNLLHVFLIEMNYNIVTKLYKYLVLKVQIGQLYREIITFLPKTNITLYRNKRWFLGQLYADIDV